MVVKPNELPRGESLLVFIGCLKTQKERSNTVMIKRIVSLLALVLILTTFIFPTNILADSPEEDSSEGQYSVSDVINDMLSNPVYPTAIPTDSNINLDQSTLLAGDWYHNIVAPYKSGSSAKGEAWTRAAGGIDDPQYEYVTVWLWYWNGSSWGDAIAEASDWGYCGGFFPKCIATAIATKTNASTGYYICTSSHRIDSVYTGTIYSATEESSISELTY